MRSRIEGCREGGVKSGATRRLAAKRCKVELAIAHQRVRGQYNHNTASKIAAYFGVSPRYVRMLAASSKEKGK